MNVKKRYLHFGGFLYVVNKILKFKYYDQEEVSDKSSDINTNQKFFLLKTFQNALLNGNMTSNGKSLSLSQ